MYPGFMYNTERGTVAAPITYTTLDSILNFKAYFNGGCCFLPCEFSGTTNFVRKQCDMTETVIDSTDTPMGRMTIGDITTKRGSTADNEKPSIKCDNKYSPENSRSVICDLASGCDKLEVDEERLKVDDEFHSMVEVLGYYSGIVGNHPAIVKCEVDNGCTVLSGVHVEYSSHGLDYNDSDLAEVIPELQAAELENKTCFVSLLKHLGLKTV